VQEEEGGAKPRWPAWYAPVAWVCALVLAILATLLLVLGLSAAGVDRDYPGLQVAQAVVQNAAFVGTGLFFASRRGPLRAADFGLRTAPLRTLLIWGGLALVGLLALDIVYDMLVPSADQSVAKPFKGEGAGVLLLAGLTIVAVVPFVEEFFFRGFLYRALRTRLGVTAAALIDGVLFFGLAHLAGSNLEALPPIAVGGVGLCLVYERTGSLYAAIGVHAGINAVGFAGEVGGGAWIVSLATGLAMIVGSFLLARRPSPRGAPAAG